MKSTTDEKIDETRNQLKKSQKAERKAAAKKARRTARSHPYTRKAAKIALDDIKKSDTLLSSLIDWEKYEKEGKLTHKRLGKNKDDKETLQDILARLSNCSINALTVNAVRCLFSGVTKERAFDKMFKAAMQAMDLDVFGFFIGGLPPNVQAELREKFEKEFGNIPLPWEEEYDSGAGRENQYKSYLGSKQKIDKSKQEQIERLIENYDKMIFITQSQLDAVPPPVDFFDADPAEEFENDQKRQAHISSRKTKQA